MYEENLTDNYINLATAIIKTAMKDYVRSAEGSSLHYDCINFFKSDYCTILAGGITGDVIMEQCRKRREEILNEKNSDES